MGHTNADTQRLAKLKLLKHASFLRQKQLEQELFLASRQKTRARRVFWGTALLGIILGLFVSPWGFLLFLKTPLDLRSFTKRYHKVLDLGVKHRDLMLVNAFLKLRESCGWITDYDLTVAKKLYNISAGLPIDEGIVNEHDQRNAQNSR